MLIVWLKESQYTFVMVGVEELGVIDWVEGSVDSEIIEVVFSGFICEVGEKDSWGAQDEIYIVNTMNCVTKKD